MPIRARSSRFLSFRALPRSWSLLLLVGVMLGSAVVLTGCATKRNLNRANEALETGDYYTASVNAVNVLQDEPTHPEAQAILIQAFPKGLKQVEREIQARAASTEPKMTDYVVNRYNELIVLNNRVQALAMTNEATGKPVSVKTVDYQADYEAARERAADAYYQYGRRVGDDPTATRQQYKFATRAMRKADNYVPGHRDASDLARQYQEAGTYRVVVGTFDQIQSLDEYGSLGSIIVTDALAKLDQDAQFQEFVDVVGVVNPGKTVQTTTSVTSQTEGHVEVTPMNVVREVLGIQSTPTVTTRSTQQQVRSYDVATATKWAGEQDADFLVIGRVEQVLLGEPQISTRSVVEEEDVTVRTETYTDAEGDKQEREIKETVYARGTVYEMEAKSSMRVTYQVLDVGTGAVRHSNTLQGGYAYNHTWARFTGDLRAVVGREERWIEAEEGALPPASVQVNDMVGDVSIQLYKELKEQLE